MIPKGEGYMDILKGKMDLLINYHPKLHTFSQKYIDLGLNNDFELKIKSFMKLCSSTNQVLK